MIFILLDYNEIDKNKNLVNLALDVTCVDVIAQVSLTQWSIFLFLDVPTRKLRIITIIFPTDRPYIIFPTARTTNN